MPTRDILPLKPPIGKTSPRFDTLPPLGLYIHIPWCVRKCPYCDFNSHPLESASVPESAYLDALIADLEQDLPLVWGRPVETIFIGGGTPSLLSSEGVEKLLSLVRARLPLRPHAEITLEANPGTVEAERFQGFRDAGINRLSLGVQSFHDRLLERIGRIHTGQQAQRAVELARDAGFDHINLDLMFGLPGQSAAMAEQDLQTALALQPEHISYYQLTIEPGTPFHRQPPPQPDEDCLAEMQHHGRRLLTAHGYDPYEISAFAKNGRQCLHNLNYWRFGDYLGIGAGAHAKITDPHTHTILRQVKRRNPRRYLESAGSSARIQHHCTLKTEEIPLEFMMNALRLTEGFDSRLFNERTGLPLSVITPALERAENAGLLERENLTVRATPRGRSYLNNLLEYFVMK